MKQVKEPMKRTVQIEIWRGGRETQIKVNGQRPPFHFLLDDQILRDVFRLRRIPNSDDALAFVGVFEGTQEGLKELLTAWSDMAVVGFMERGKEGNSYATRPATVAEIQAFFRKAIKRRGTRSPGRTK